MFNYTILTIIRRITILKYKSNIGYKYILDITVFRIYSDNDIIVLECIIFEYHLYICYPDIICIYVILISLYFGYSHSDLFISCSDLIVLGY